MRTALLLAFVLAACGTEEVVCERDPPLTYENFGQGFLGRHCLGCHSSLIHFDERNGAPDAVNYNTWANVLAWADRIQVRATGDERNMPPSGGPTEEEIHMFTEWLACEVMPASDGHLVSDEMNQ